MEPKNVHAERPSWIARQRVWRGHCPRCEGPLVEEHDRDRVEAWSHVPGKYTVRTIGGARMRGFPVIHNVEVQHCLRCDACERWFVGRWAYRRVE
jgi:uncharacterized protein YbaR (Trm112 family)